MSKMFKITKRILKISLLLVFFDCHNQESHFASVIDLDSPKSWSEGMILNDKKEGLWLSFVDSQLVSKECYLNGILNGEFFIYRNLSEFSEHGFYKMGHLNGPYERYGENNVLHLKGKYTNGKREGIWLEYISNAESPFDIGKLNKVVDYRNDTILKILKNYCYVPAYPGEIRNCDKRIPDNEKILLFEDQKILARLVSKTQSIINFDFYNPISGRMLKKDSFRLNDGCSFDTSSVSTEIIGYDGTNLILAKKGCSLMPIR